MISAVLFDLDGTLHDRDATVARFALDQGRRLACCLSVEPEAYARRFVALDAHGYQPKEHIFDALLAEGVLNGITTEALRVDFNANFARQSVLMPGAAEALTWCRSRGLRTGLVTNGRVAMQQEKVRALGLCALLDTVVISEAEGITKPHSSIFHRAVARLGGEPGAAVFVGDHPEADIAGARAAGLHAIWVQVPYWAPPTDMHAQVLCLTELPDVLLRLGAQTADVPAAW